MSWIQLKSFFPGVTAKFGLTEESRKKTVFSLWEKTVLDVCGKNFASKSVPVRLKNGVLFVECLNSLWANEFKVRGEVLLAGLREKTEIQTIRFLF